MRLPLLSAALCLAITSCGPPAFNGPQPLAYRPSSVTCRDPASGAVLHDTARVDQHAERVAGSFVPLQYPRIMRDSGIEGRVVLAYVIDTTGRADPASVRVVSATRSDFVPPAIATIVSGRYTPGVRGGRPVRICVATPLTFTIAGF